MTLRKKLLTNYNAPNDSRKSKWIAIADVILGLSASVATQVPTMPISENTKQWTLIILINVGVGLRLAIKALMPNKEN